MLGAPLLAAEPPPAVRVFADDVAVLYYGDVRVGIESGDGAPHRVRVRVETPPGLQAPDPAVVEVPASGRVTTAVRVWRSTATRGTRPTLVVVAEPADGDTAERWPGVSAIVAADIRPDPAWMPKLRRPLGVVALLLMSAAALMEVRRRL